jgi:membrane protease YdiL (CAAX protease family)
MAAQTDMVEASQPHRGSAEVLGFFALAYAISWAIALPRVAARRGWIASAIPMWLHYLVPLGPSLAAVALCARRDGRAGVATLIRRVLRWRVSVGWWLVALASPLVALAGTVLALRLVQGSWLDLRPFGEAAYLGRIGYVGSMVLWIASYGIGEEIGWRGFALPGLQRRHGALVATLLLVPGWALWHLPMFLYHQSFIDMGVGGSIGWLVGLAFGAAFFTWLFNSTGGSVLLCAVWHGSFNFTVSSNASSSVAAVISTVVMVMVVVIVVRHGARDLSSQPRILAVHPGSRGECSS